MSLRHYEFLVEEPSMEAFLRQVLPSMLPEDVSFEVYPHQGKDDLLKKLPDRLHGYASWIPDEWRIVVLVDRDDSSCRKLKLQMERIAHESGMRVKGVIDQPGNIINCIAIEELEAWYFGDWDAVQHIYPRVSDTVPQKAAYRNPDAIEGGTWEAFERILKRAGYFKTGLRKLEVARAIGGACNVSVNRSKSFQYFRNALLLS